MFYKDVYDTIIPRTAQLQSKLGLKTDTLYYGALMFFGESDKKITHVAIYVGDNKLLQATSHGSRIDSIGSIVWDTYWGQKYLFCKTI